MDFNEPAQDDPDWTCYRPGQEHLIVSVLAMLFFAGCGAISVATALRNVDGSFPNPAGFAIFFGVIWSFMVLVGVWYILVWRRHRLYLGPNGILNVGVFRRAWLPRQEVTKVHWRRKPGAGSVVVQTSSAKSTIYFDNYSRADREQVKWYLSESFPEQIQIHPRKLTRSGMIAVLVTLATLFYFCASCSTLFWIAWGGAASIAMVVINAAGGSWFLYRAWWVAKHWTGEVGDSLGDSATGKTTVAK